MANTIAISAVALAVLSLCALLIAARRKRDALFIDSSTGLPDRRALFVEAAVGAQSLVVARLDRFDALAANLGEDRSARLMLRVAERLTLPNQVRIHHVGNGLLGWAEPASSQTFLEDRLEIIDRLMRSPVDCGRLVDIRLHFGIAALAGRAPDHGLVCASQAADHAAKNGLRWHYFGVDSGSESDLDLTLLSQLDAAMTAGQLWNVYQPKLSLVSGRIVGAEALVRWFHPTLGQIAPATFIPLLEKHGRDRDMMLHVIARVIEDAAQWESTRLEGGIAINIGPALLRDGGFMEQVARMLSHGSMAADRITVELSAMIQISDADVEAMQNWRNIGFAVSIGDGDPSLSCLQELYRLPVDELKIDRSLVRDLASDEFKIAVLRSAIGLAHTFDVRVVAEGVEHAEVLRVLREIKCDVAQGYYIGRPMSAANLRVFLGGGSTQAA